MKMRHLLATAGSAVVVASLLTAAGPASATAAPPWETGNSLFTAALNYPNLDPNSKGGLVFYDASGSVITGGNDLTHISDFVGTTGTPARTNASLATLSYAFPDHTKADSTTWAAVSGSASTNFPVASPAPVAALGSTDPVASLTATDGNVQAPAQVATLDATAGYANIIQVRLKDSGIGVPSGGLNNAKYFWSADIEYNTGASALGDGLAAGSWKVVYPVPPVAATTTSITTPVVVPATNPAASGSAVTFQATVNAADSTHPAGSVHFLDGVTDLGAATYNTGTGLASLSGQTLSVASHSITAAFTASVPASYAASASAALTFNVVNPDGTSTVLVAAPVSSADTSTPVVLTATVSDTTTPATVPPGSVTFSDGVTVLASGVALNGSGVAVKTIAASTLSIGAHSFTATYVPTGLFAASDSTGSPITYTVTLPAPANVIAPALGAARVGVAISCNPGTWTYAGVYSYAWALNGVAIVGATSSSLGVLTASYFGKSVLCTVTATNPTSSVPASSAVALVAAGAAPVASVKPKIVYTGIAAVGKTFTASRGTWTLAPTSYLYVWKRGTVIVRSGATAMTYKAVAADKGKVLTLYVSAFKAGYLTGVATSVGVLVH